MWTYLIEKEFRQFMRDPGLPRMVIMFPLLMIFVFPFVMSMEIRNISLVVVDSDRSRASSALVETCTSSGYFTLIEVTDDPAAAQEMMDSGKADAILTIGSGLDEALQAGEDLPVGIKVNAVNSTKGSLGAQYLTACLGLFRQNEAVLSGNGSQSAPVAEITEHYLYNPYLDYKVFMVPALIVVAVTMMCGFMPALNIVREKEAGTIEQINVTPVRKSTFILCKMAPYVVVAYFMLFVCLLLAWFVFGFVCRGSILLLCLFTLLQIIAVSGLGLLISSYSANAQQAMFVIWFFMMVFMLMSGIFTPVASMPDWARTVTYINPMMYYADAMRCIFLKGCTLSDLWPDALGLTVLGAGTVSWAILSYRKTS